MSASRPSRWRRLRWLYTFLGDYKVLFPIGLLLGCVDAACQSLVPMLFRHILNSIENNPGEPAFGHIGPILGWSFLLLVIFFVGAFFFHVLTAIGGARFCRNMQVSLYDHIQRLSADFFHRNAVGEVTQRINGDIDTVQGSLGTIAYMVWATVLLVQSGIMMAIIDWRLSLLFLVLAIVLTLFTQFYMPRLKRMNREVRDAVGEVSAKITEYVGMLPLIKSYSRESMAERRIRLYSDRVRAKRERLQWWHFLFFDLMQVLVRFVAPLSLLYIGAWMISQGSLRSGDLVAFWGFWLMMGGTLSSIVTQVGALFAVSASVDRIVEFFDEVPRIQDAPDAREIEEVRGGIQFENVCFKYPNDRGGPVLHGVNLDIRPGEHVAFVGPSGAGKSTVMQLIMRFYDPDTGVVRLDGEDVRRFKQRSLRRQIGVVMQDSVFFAGSVADNLRLARPNATEAEMIESLRNANAWEFVSQLEDGLNTMLGERGMRLSGGQKQRLSIARVFLKNPPILLFDEATSALDSVSEKVVKEAMDRLMKGRTSVVVAHRLSTVLDADRICVFQEGRIVDCGHHADLLARNPLYQDLCRAQGLV